MGEKLKMRQSAFFGPWKAAARHGVRCYSLARLNRHVQLRMAPMRSPVDAMRADFAVIGLDLNRAMQANRHATPGC